MGSNVSCYDSFVYIFLFFWWQMWDFTKHNMTLQSHTIKDDYKLSRVDFMFFFILYCLNCIMS